MRLLLQLQAYTTTGTLHYYPIASSPYIRHFKRGPKNERQFLNTTLPPCIFRTNQRATGIKPIARLSLNQESASRRSVLYFSIQELSD